MQNIIILFFTMILLIILTACTGVKSFIMEFEGNVSILRGKKIAYF